MLINRRNTPARGAVHKLRNAAPVEGVHQKRYVPRYMHGKSALRQGELGINSEIQRYVIYEQSLQTF